MFYHKDYPWVEVYHEKFSPNSDEREQDSTSSSEMDNKLLNFIRREIPDSYFRNGNKTLLIETLSAARTRGASPSDLFKLLLFVHEQRIITSLLPNLDLFMKLQTNYRKIRNSITSNRPFLFYREDISRPHGRRIMSAIDTLDELMKNAASSYEVLRKEYKPGGRGLKKAGHLRFMVYAFMYLAERTKCTCDGIYTIIADLLSTFSAKDYDPGNVKQQLHSMARRSSEKGGTPGEMAALLRRRQEDDEYFSWRKKQSRTN